MNYGHAFHAGNFADVLKHAVLCRVLHHCAAKPAAFRVHRHPCRRRPLRSCRARGRARRRMARRHRTADGGSAAGGGGGLLAPYLDAVRAFNPDGRLNVYPGSPLIARALLRRQDRLIACELEPKAAAALAAQSARRPRVKALRDRRLDRARRLCAAEGAARPGADRSAVRAGQRFRAGCPARSRRRTANGRPASTCSGIRSRTRGEPDALARRLRRLGSPKILRAELIVAPMADPDRLNGSRPDRGQSALDAGPGACRPAAGAWRKCSAATAPVAFGWIGSPGRPRDEPARAVDPFSQGKSWCLVPSLAVTFRLRWGAGGVTEAG